MKTIKEYPSQEYLCSILNYNPDTGVFTWKYREDWSPQNNGKYGDKIAGYDNQGYWKINVDGKMYQAHRLAWIMIYGDIGKNFVPDHKDGNGLNNKINNLRKSTQGLNSANAKKREGKILPKGVGQLKGYSNFRARIMVDGQAVFLGTFATIDEAQAAYYEAATKYFGEFAKVG